MPLAYSLVYKIYPKYLDTEAVYNTCAGILAKPILISDYASRKHAYIILTPLNPTFI